MSSFRNVCFPLLAVALLAGCASSEVTERRSYASGKNIAKPSRIIVYDIAASPDDVPPTAGITGKYHRRDKPQTAQEIALGRRLGTLVADRLVREIRNMGMPAERPQGRPTPNVGDLVITGYFISVDEGSRGKRFIIGFGAGAGKLKTFVQESLVTPSGLKPLSSARARAGGGRMPGMAAPLVIMGGIAGRPAQAAVIAGGLNIMQELGPERIQSAANRSARDLSGALRDSFRQRGWIK